jgi:hypothetical protein
MNHTIINVDIPTILTPGGNYYSRTEPKSKETKKMYFTLGCLRNLLTKLTLRHWFGILHKGQVYGERHVQVH